MSRPSPTDVGKFVCTERSAAIEGFPAPNWYPQQKKWILDPENSDTIAYNYPLPLRIQGRLDSRVLESALQEIVRRHEVFRSSFQLKDGEQFQIIVPAKDFAIRQVDLSELTSETRDPLLRDLVMDDENRPFDMRFELLLRATLIRLTPDDHILLLTTHHMVCDDWSAGILLDELLQLYAAFARGKESPLPPLPYSYRQFAQQLARRLKDREFEAQLRFWREQLRNARDFYHLAEDRPRTSARVCPASHLRTPLPSEIWQGIQTLSQRERVSPFMILAGAFQCVLARISNDKDVGIGVCVANRNSTEIEALIGPFSNRIVFRTDLSGNLTFREMLSRVRNVALDAYSNQDLPFGEAVDGMIKNSNLDRHPLFQALMILEEAGTNPVETLGLEIHILPFDSAHTRYDLNVWLRIEESRGLEIRLQYNSDLFHGRTMQRVLQMYRDVLETITKNPDARVFEVQWPQGRATNPAADVPLPEVSRPSPRDEIESRLQRVWGQILGINSTGIDIYQDFFELGGDSLKAAQLFMQIEKEFHVRLAVSSLLEARSIAALADLIRVRTLRRKEAALVAVQPSGGRLPIFCIHTHTGSVLFCRDFPKYMGADQPIYGLQSPGVSDGSPDVSVEQMASRYIEELKNVQPCGLYRLFGYSFGGLVAFEIANQLLARGDRVAFLGMFNTPAPGSLKGWPLGQSSYLQKRIGDELDKLQGFSATAKIAHVLQNGWNFSHMVMRSVKTDAWRLMARILKPQTAGRLAARMLDVGHVNIAAAKNYQPAGIFSGCVTFFLTKQVPYAYSPGPEAGWGPLASGGVEILQIPDDTRSSLEERFARTVCDRIRISIEQDS